MIRVRSSPGKLDDLLPGLQDVLASLPCETQCLQHGVYKGDLAALLIWHHGSPTQTREGSLIAARLQSHGSVDHAVWISTSRG